MKKIILISSLILVFGVLTSSTYCKNQKKDKTASHSLVTISKAKGKNWVKECLQKYPEIIWLADENVQITQEGNKTFNNSFSEQLFNKKFVEFDRTIMTFHCLRLILDGSFDAYQEFTKKQPQNLKLSQKSFMDLHIKGQYLLKSNWNGLSENEMLQTMETALVLGDLGKSEKARQVFKSIKAVDHDVFHEQMIKVLKSNPRLSSSFNKLSKMSKKLLFKSTNLAHYGHITHLEGDPLMFEKLKESKIVISDPIAFLFDFFVHICDVSGALGHIENSSSLVYTENTHISIMAAEHAIFTLIDSEKTEIDAFNTYLSDRAKLLGLKSNDRMDRVLTRIGSMMRLFKLEEGEILKAAVNKLDHVDRERIINQLDVQQIKKIPTPTYMPAVLVNLMNNTNLSSFKEERLTQAVLIGLPFIAKVLEEYELLLENKQIKLNEPLNFNLIAKIAKNSPEELVNKKFSIEDNAFVIIK
jgi:Family of unknown function (DUF6829)